VCGVGQVRLSVCVCVIAGMPSSRRSARQCVCGVGQARLCVCVIRGIPVAIDLLERVSVRCWAGPSVYVCVSYEECRLAVGLPDSECVVLGRSVCLCVCVIRGMPSSRRSAGESECAVLGRSVCLCVCHTRNAM